MIVVRVAERGTVQVDHEKADEPRISLLDLGEVSIASVGVLRLYRWKLRQRNQGLMYPLNGLPLLCRGEFSQVESVTLHFDLAGAAQAVRRLSELAPDDVRLRLRLIELDRAAGRWAEVAEDLAHRDVLIDDIVADFLSHVEWITLPILLSLLTTDIVIFRRALRPLCGCPSMRFPRRSCHWCKPSTKHLTDLSVAFVFSASLPRMRPTNCVPPWRF